MLPGVVDGWSLADGVSPVALEAAFATAAAAGRPAAAALVVSPTYFGLVSDITGAHVQAGQHKLQHLDYNIFDSLHL